MHATQVTEYILDTVDSGEGSWPCLFYELNYNTDITWAEKAKWYALTEDESYWREGIGPFSIDENKFFVTQWQSSLHPILIRRHFTLSSADMVYIAAGTITLHFSYDEDPVFWLNGRKLTTASGWNDNNYATLRLSSTQKKWLQEGDNVLCVSLRQGAGGGHIDYGLSLKYDDQNTGIVGVMPDDGQQSTDDRQQTTDNMIYNLNGQPATSAKGITIRRGKKFLKK